METPVDWLLLFFAVGDSNSVLYSMEASGAKLILYEISGPRQTIPAGLTDGVAGSFVVQLKAERGRVFRCLAA